MWVDILPLRVWEDNKTKLECHIVCLIKVRIACGNESLHCWKTVCFVCFVSFLDKSDFGCHWFLITEGV